MQSTKESKETKTMEKTKETNDTKTVRKRKEHLKDPGKYKEAKALHHKGYSFTQIERLMGIPRSTLYDHIKGSLKDIDRVITSGPDRILSEEDETTVVEGIEYIASRGMSPSRQHLRVLIREVVRRKGLHECSMNLDNGPSNEYLRKFIRRNKEKLIPILIVDNHPPKTSNKTTFGANDQSHVDHFFSVLEDFMVKLNITNDPSRLFVICEYFFSGQLKSSKKVVTMVYPEGPSFQYQPLVTLDNHITVVQATSAACNNCPTMTIFKGHVPKATHPIDENVLFMRSTEDGYLNDEMMITWFDDIFLPSVGETRPILLLMDNNKCHWSLSFIEKAKENNIEILYLPSHVTYLLQPLNVHFQELKQDIADLAVSQGCLGCHKLSQSLFADILHQVLVDKILSTVTSSFAYTGIFPLKRKTVQELSIRYCAQTEDWKTRQEQSESDACKTCGQVKEESSVKIELVKE